MWWLLGLLVLWGLSKGGSGVGGAVFVGGGRARGVTVRVLDATGNRVVAQTTSDARGLYSVGLRPGNYIAVASIPGQNSSQVPFQVVQGQPRANANLSLF